MWRFVGRAIFGAAILLLGMASTARSDSCRVLVFRFQPVPYDPAHDFQYGGRTGDGAFEERGPQVAIWLETAPTSGVPPAARGSHVADVFVTARTASFGIGNRAGNGQFGSSPRFPYGARDGVLPVWAFARGHEYPLLVMQNGNQDSFGFHENWSTPENFFCKPMQLSQMVDAVSCPSQNFSSDKGEFDTTGKKSLYPPRHDIPAGSCRVVGQGCNYACDSPDCRMLADLDDIAAISGATPNPYFLHLPYAGMWQVPAGLADGDYWVFLEVNKQFDNDTKANGPCTATAPYRDTNSGFCTAHPAATDDMGLTSGGWGIGNNLGQPSTVWATRITIDSTGVHTATADNYIGYGPWDHPADRPMGGDASWNRGIHPPDSTISMTPGSGGNRLAEITDGDGTWRFKVLSSPCGSCEAAVPPPAIDDLKVVALDGDLVQVTFSQVGFGQTPVMAYQVKYLLGDKMDINDFETANPGPTIPPDVPGTKVSFELGQHEGIQAQRSFMIGARAVGDCMKQGDLRVVQVVTPRKKFATVEGCFIATAAFGSELEPEVKTLRGFRDRYLMRGPIGRSLVRLYYGASPPMARAIATDDAVRAQVRQLLRPLIGFAHMAQP
jgi:hypothetical protein